MEFTKKLTKINEISRAIILPKVLLEYLNVKDDDELIISDYDNKTIVIRKK